MTSGVAPPTTSILDEITSIAGLLGRTDVLERSEAVVEYRRAPKLRLLIVGLTGSGRATLANTLLGRPDLLPESPIPKPPIGLEIRHGERLAAVRLKADGESVAVPAGSLHSLLRGGAETSDTCLEIRVPSTLLETYDLRIESLDDDRRPSEWRAVLAGTDYVILALNATALLSDVERRFVREVLVPAVGLERVALALTHMDLVPEEERESLLEILRAFLGPYESQPAILDLALRGTADASGATGRDMLNTLVDDLLERRMPLRTAALRQTMVSILDDLESVAEEMESFYALEGDDLERAKESMAAQRAWIERRTTRMYGRIEAFVSTLLKERLLRRVERFGETVRARLPREIESIEDLGLVRRHLPGYLKTLWTEFLRGEMIAVRRELVAEEARINTMIDADLTELLRGTRPETEDVERDFERDPLGVHVFIMPKRGKHRATNVARGLSFNGLIMLFLAPQVGILSLAASQVIQRLYREDIASADRRALVDSTLAANKDLEREIKDRIQEQFETITAQLKEDISRTYTRGLDHATEMLDERMRHREDLQTRRAELAVIVHERLPRLRALLDGTNHGEAP